MCVAVRQVSSLSGLLGGLCSISLSLQTGVQLDATYRALSQQRHQQANECTRTVQRVDAKDILTAQRNARLREPASMKSAIKRNVSTVMLVLFHNYNVTGARRGWSTI